MVIDYSDALICTKSQFGLNRIAKPAAIESLHTMFKITKYNAHPEWGI